MNELRKKLENAICVEGYIIDLVEECLMKEIAEENNADKKIILNEMREIVIDNINDNKTMLELLDEYGLRHLNKLNELAREREEIDMNIVDVLFSEEE